MDFCYTATQRLGEWLEDAPVVLEEDGQEVALAP